MCSKTVNTIFFSGVCLETLHVMGDQLCKDSKFNKIERPRIGPASYGQGDLTDSIIADVSQVIKQASNLISPAFKCPHKLLHRKEVLATRPP